MDTPRLRRRSVYVAPVRSWRFTNSEGANGKHGHRRDKGDALFHAGVLSIPLLSFDPACTDHHSRSYRHRSREDVTATSQTAQRTESRLRSQILPDPAD